MFSSYASSSSSFISSTSQPSTNPFPFSLQKPILYGFFLLLVPSPPCCPFTPNIFKLRMRFLDFAVKFFSYVLSIHSWSSPWWSLSSSCSSSSCKRTPKSIGGLSHPSRVGHLEVPFICFLRHQHQHHYHHCHHHHHPHCLVTIIILIIVIVIIIIIVATVIIITLSSYNTTCHHRNPKILTSISLFLVFTGAGSIAPTLWYERHGHHLLYDLLLKGDYAEKYDWKFANFAIANLRRENMIKNL